MRDCVFCGRIARDEHSGDVYLGDVVRFEPLNPVTPGHMLFVPCEHVRDASEDPDVTALVFGAAARYAADAEDAFNLITSAGRWATQTVFHLHVHYVPRLPDDGLHLPWTGQVRS